MEVHIFRATSSPCVANLFLRRTATANARKFSPHVVAVVEKNFYVDSALPSVSSDISATRVAADLAEMLEQGRFCLTQFISNSEKVLSSIPVERIEMPHLDTGLDELPVMN